MFPVCVVFKSRLQSVAVSSQFLEIQFQEAFPAKNLNIYYILFVFCWFFSIWIQEEFVRAGTKAWKGRNQSNEGIKLISQAEARAEFAHVMGL